MKKVLAIVGGIVLVLIIGLYIYSQGGYQDIHIAKGKHLDEAISKPVSDLLNAEFEGKVRIYNLESDTTLNSIEKTWQKWNYPYPYKTLYADDKDIYWGHVRFDFLRNEIVELYKTNKEDYDKTLEKFDHITLEKAREMIAKYYNNRRFISEQKIIEPKDVGLYKIRVSGTDSSNKIPYSIEFKVFIGENIYDAYFQTGEEVYHMHSSSLITSY